MLKRVGVLALLLCGGAFLHPTVAGAQEYRGGYGDGRQYHDEGRSSYRDRDGFREEHREHEWREQEQRERRWQEREWREHERWEHRGYGDPYRYAPRAYYGNRY